MSVPLRRGAYRSALADVWVNRGSTLISLPPRSLAFMIHLKEIGWLEAGLDPIARITSALRMSIQ